MKSIRKTTSFMLAVLLTGILLPLTVHAAGNITLSSDIQNAVVGDTVTVTYEAEDLDNSAEAPQIEITYDPNRLSLQACDKEYGGGEGGLLQFSETSATITFSVMSGGTAEVDATAIFGGDGAEPATSFITIEVEGEDTAAALSAAASSSTGIEAGTIVSSDGTKIVSTVFADDYMPALFHKEAGTYQGQPVEVAKFDMGDITLVYVTDTTGANGNFNILDTATGELSDYKMIQGIENHYIIILRAPADVQTPNGFTKAELQWDGLSLEAYAVNAVDSTIISDVPATDFFLLYAISSEGYKGWFLYDQVGGTYQRYLPVTNAPAESEDEEGGFFSALKGGGADEGEYQSIAFRRLIIIGIMAVVMIVMFIFLLNFFMKLRDYQSYDYVDEEEEDDIRSQPVRREPSVEETSRIRASELARMEMGETFEPVNFDKLVNDPFEKKSVNQAPKSVTTPEAAAAKLSQAEAAKASAVKEAPSASIAKPAAEAKTVTPAATPAPAEKPAAPTAAPTAQAPAKPAAQAATTQTPAAPAAQAAPAKPAAPGKIASVEDFVKPASPDAFKDDYDEDEDEGGLFSRKKKDKKKNKNMGFDDPEEMDWSTLEGSMKSEDDRRPKGGESPYVKKYGSPDVTPSAVEPPKVETPKVDLPTNVPKPGSDKTIKPVSQTFKETVPQQDSSYWTQSTASQYQEPQYPQNNNQGYDPYAQQYVQQGYDPYAQQYNQGYDSYAQQYAQQGYDPYAQQYNQGYDPYAQNQYAGYNQGYGYNQNPYNTQSMDFDDDFEFEFIDINR